MTRKEKRVLIGRIIAGFLVLIIVGSIVFQVYAAYENKQQQDEYYEQLQNITTQQESN